MSNANIEGTLQEIRDGMKEIVPGFKWKATKNSLFRYGKISREINRPGAFRGFSVALQEVIRKE